MTIHFPPHHSLYIEHNEHKDYYLSVKEYLQDMKYTSEEISDEDLQKCIEKDELWSIRLYPLTPISFYLVYSYSLERCIELIHEATK